MSDKEQFHEAILSGKIITITSASKLSYYRVLLANFNRVQEAKNRRKLVPVQGERFGWTVVMKKDCFTFEKAVLNYMNLEAIKGDEIDLTIAEFERALDRLKEAQSNSITA